jgi:methylmalonyl-CoA/ethylmalonyl-CoA epimerase
MKIEHIGIAVQDLEKSKALFAAIFGQPPYKDEHVESEHVDVSFFQLADSKIELLQATSPESAIAKHIEKRGEGMHHIAFEVPDIYAAMERMKAQGYRLLNEAPKRGADNKLIFFLHPKDTNGVLVELCQEISVSAESE